MRWNSWRVLAWCAALLTCAATAIWSRAGMRSLSTASARQEPAPAQSWGQARSRAEFLVIVDAGHGGDDSGAALPGKLLEKDLTLALARELKKELEDRGVAVRLLRDSDLNLTLERRAEITNEARPSLYVALHAGVPGQGARVYAPALPSVSSANGPFVSWENAQAASIDQSKTAARVVSAEIRKTGMAVRVMTTPLRPLNNLVAPAIAVEWATGQQALRPQQMQKVETVLASSIASGIVQARSQLGARR
jgi:N-acetylmuramoyl-L-alanine amidase